MSLPVPYSALNFPIFPLSLCSLFPITLLICLYLFLILHHQMSGSYVYFIFYSSSTLSIKLYGVAGIYKPNRVFQSCISSIPVMHIEYSSHAYRVFQSCISSIPVMHIEYSSHAYRVFQSCITSLIYLSFFLNFDDQSPVFLLQYYSSTSLVS